MAPKKKTKQIEGQKPITNFFRASQGATESATADPSSSSAAAGILPNRVASAPARTDGGTVQAATNSMPRLPDRAASTGSLQRRTAANSTARAKSTITSGTAASSAAAGSGLFGRPSSNRQGTATAEMPVVGPPLTETAARLSSRLQQEVNNISAGTAGNIRYQWSRTAQQAMGGSDDMPNQGMENEEKEQILCRAYLLVSCFRRLNEQQRCAAMSDISLPLLILAGAGTGKTSTLICRILYLLSQGVRQSQILAITFTNKAAGELKQRLQQAIDEAWTITQRQVAGSTEQQQEQQQTRAAERKGQQVKVLACTFHSYCYRIVRSRWGACGFSQCPVVWAEKEARQALKLAMRLAKLDEVRGQMARWLNAADDSWPGVQTAARHRHSELMREWATKVSEAKAAAAKKQAAQQTEDGKQQGRKRKQEEAKPARNQQMLQQAAQTPGQSRLEQFATRELKVLRQESMADVSDGQVPDLVQQQGKSRELQRAESRTPEGQRCQPTGQQQQQLHDMLEEAKCGQLNAMGPPRARQQQATPQQQQQQQVQQQSVQEQQHEQPATEQPQPTSGQQQSDDAQGSQKEVNALTEQQLQLEGKLLLYDLLRKEYDRRGDARTAEEVGKAPKASAVKKCQKMIDNIKCKDEDIDMYAGLEVVFAHYQRLLQLCNAVDFNDLLRLTVRLFKEHPQILEQQVRRWPYLLVDEFQDCNQQQIDLVDLLQQTYKRVTVVGDDAQSIYRFRGAVPDVFKVFKAAYSHLNLVRQLEVNYRSTPQILAVGRAMLTNSGLIPKDLQPTISGEGKPPVRLLVLDTEEHEARVIAQEAKRIHEEGKVDYSDMAVLFRAFKCEGGRAHSKLQQALVREGIPFVLVRDTSLFQRVEVLDLTAYIILALNHNDDAAFKRILNTPSRRLGPKLMEQLENEQQEALAALVDSARYNSNGDDSEQPGVSLFSTAERLLKQGLLAPAHANRVRDFLFLIKHLSGVIKGVDPAEAVMTVLEQVPGFIAHVEKIKKDRRKREEGDAVAKQKEADVDEAEEQQQQQQQTAQQGSQSQSVAGTEGTAVDAAAGDDDSDSEDDEAVAAAVIKDSTPEQACITPALAALYQEAVAFSKAWALEHGVAVRTGQQPAAEAADTNGAAARTETTAAEPTSASGDSDSTGPRKLFDLVSEQVTTTWSSEQLAESLPDFLLEEIYAAAGKGSRVVSELLAHLTLNPHGEEEHSALMSDQEEVKPGALVISTIHAAKGLEYDTCFVPRWNDRFLPMCRPKSDRDRDEQDDMDLDDEDIVDENERARRQERRAVLTEEQAQREEEQRLAHVAVTRAKIRLILTRARFVKLPDRVGGFKDLTWRQAAFLNPFSEATPSEFLQYLKGLNDRRPGTIEFVNLSEFPCEPDRQLW